MVMEEPGRLEGILEGIHLNLAGELAGSRAAVQHSGSRGDASEEGWLRVLKEHLPSRYQADRAFVVDAHGAVSEQIDVVIYDRQYSPLLYNQASQLFVPAESVYGVLEVKQELTKEYIAYSGTKAASVRRLDRTSAEIRFAAGSYEPRDIPGIVAGMVAYKSSWIPPFGDPFRTAISELGLDEQLQIGCCLVDGMFEVTYGDAEPDVEIHSSERSLLRFLLALLRRLQSVGTVPAIDYSAYLDTLDRISVKPPTP